MLELEKRDCNIKMELIPRGAGWIHVHLTIGGECIGFVISSAMGERFSKLLRVMYHLYPDNNDPEFADDIYCWEGLCKRNDSTGEYEVVKIVERIEGEPFPYTMIEIPHKAEFYWDQEGADCSWIIEREPTEDTDFAIEIRLKYSDEDHERCYEVQYKDFCYAIAKACTETLKRFGIFGYHHSTYEEDIPMRYFLFLKAVALGRLDLLKLNDVEEERFAVTSSFEKEMELLLFDM